MIIDYDSPEMRKLRARFDVDSFMKSRGLNPSLPLDVPETIQQMGFKIYSREFSDRYIGQIITNDEKKAIYISDKLDMNRDYEEIIHLVSYMALLYYDVSKTFHISIKKERTLNSIEERISPSGAIIDRKNLTVTSPDGEVTHLQDIEVEINKPILTNYRKGDPDSYWNLMADSLAKRDFGIFNYNDSPEKI